MSIYVTPAPISTVPWSWWMDDSLKWLTEVRMPSVDGKPGLTLCQEHLIANGMNVAGKLAKKLPVASLFPSQRLTTNGKILGSTQRRRNMSKAGENGLRN